MQAEPNCSRREWLADGAVGLFPDKSESFGNAQVGLHDLRMAKGDHLAAGVQMLGKAGHRRIRVGRGRRIMLIIIFGGKGVRRIGIPIQIRTAWSARK